MWSLKAWCCVQVTKSNKSVTIFSHLYSLSKLGNPTVLIRFPLFSDADDEDHQKQHIKRPFCWGENDQHTSCGMSWILLPTLRLQAGLHGNATGLFFLSFFPFYYSENRMSLKEMQWNRERCQFCRNKTRDLKFCPKAREGKSCSWIPRNNQFLSSSLVDTAIFHAVQTPARSDFGMTNLNFKYK